MEAVMDKFLFKEEEVVHRIKTATTGKRFFKLPLDYVSCYKALLQAFIKAVNDVNIKYVSMEGLEMVLYNISLWLVGHNHKTGLWLSGVGGTGKTTLVYAIQKLILSLRLKDPIKSSSSQIKMAGLVMKNACELCHLYVDHYERFLEYRNVSLLAIDDLGMEPERIVKYGQVCDPISELIAYRYECR